MNVILSYSLGYFIMSGQVSFCTPSGVPYRKFEKGMTLGEISLLREVMEFKFRKQELKQS